MTVSTGSQLWKLKTVVIIPSGFKVVNDKFVYTFFLNTVTNKVVQGVQLKRGLF